MDPEDVREIIWHVSGELFDERLQRSVGSLTAHTRPQQQIDDHRAARISHPLQGQIDVSFTPGESWRCDPHDLVILVIELQRAANDAWVGQVMGAPKPVRKQCDGSWLLPVYGIGRPKSASKKRGHTEI